MKKNILLILVLTLSFNSLAQKKDKEQRKTELEQRKTEKRKKSKCKIFKDNTSEFDGIRELHTQNLFIGKGENTTAGSILIKFIAFSKEKNNEFVLVFQNTGYGDECKTKSSFINIKFEDGTFLKLKPWSEEIDCGVKSLYTKITKDNLDKFLNNPISMIRSSIEINRDFKIQGKSFIKFKNEAECILNELELE